MYYMNCEQQFRHNFFVDWVTIKYLLVDKPDIMSTQFHQHDYNLLLHQNNEVQLEPINCDQMTHIRGS